MKASVVASSGSEDPKRPKLRLRSLLKRFNTNTVVDTLDLDVTAGESVVLLGPSGCGKTTTLRMVAGFEQPDGGEIELDGRTVASPTVMLPPEQRRLGMVFQNYAVWPHKTVEQNVAYGLVVAGEPRSEITRRVQEALDTVKLSGLNARYSSELSGGQQQRVALARAIVTKPSMLLLDEPLSNLDAGLREEMRLELRELHDRTKMTSLYVTHDQEEALVLADRIVVMNSGRIEQIGTPQKIYYRPANRFVANFVGVNNLLDCTVEGHEETQSAVRLVTEKGLPLRAVVPPASTAPLTAGSKVTVSIRPEQIEFCKSTEQAGVQAQVLKCVFLGNRYDFSLSIRGHRIRCQTTRIEELSGDTVTVKFDPKQIWLLP